MKFLSRLLVALSVLLIACQSAGIYEKTDTGILISVPGSDQTIRKIKLDVITDKIIHVSVSPTDTFPSQKSLMIEEKSWSPVSWSVAEKNDLVTLKTKQLHAIVSLTTG